MIVSFLLLVAAQPAMHILSTLPGRDLDRAGVQADQIAVPTGMSGSEFADRLIAEAGLAPTRDPVPAGNSNPRAMGGFGADGRNVTIFFSSDGAHSERICRIRARNSAVTPARYRAFRWCASVFGESWPATPPPPVIIPAR